MGEHLLPLRLNLEAPIQRTRGPSHSLGSEEREGRRGIGIKKETEYRKKKGGMGQEVRGRGGERGG